MNERIKQLLEENGFITEWMTSGEKNDAIRKYEMLANVLIKECVDVCNRVYFTNFPNAPGWERSEEGEAIKDHFGVQ
jgi:hypothetical protein